MKRVIIIHGWGGRPNNAWFPWLKQELEKRGFDAKVPKMPNTDDPKIKDWVKVIKRQVGKPDEGTYFVCHSIGCQAVLRYLETIRGKIGGAVFVAGWQRLTNLSAEEKPIAKPWLETLINFKKIKKTTKTFVAIFSDNDPYVSLENVKMFKRTIGAKTIMVKKKGHMGAHDKVTRLPVILEELLKIAK